MHKLKTIFTNKYFYFATLSLAVVFFCMWFIRKKQDLYLLLILFFIFALLYVLCKLVKYFLWGFLITLSRIAKKAFLAIKAKKNSLPCYLNIRINGADNHAIFIN